MTQAHVLPDSFILRHGSHQSFDEGACLLEAVSFLAGEPWSDSPACACPVLAAFGRRLNDAITDDAVRTRLLLGFAPRLIGTKASKKIEKRRAFVAVDVAVREVAPLWFDAVPELAEHAAKLRALPEIVDKKSADAGYAVRDAARSAAWAYRRSRLDRFTEEFKARIEELRKQGKISAADAVAVADAAADAAAVAVAAAAADAAAVAAAVAAADAVAVADAAADAAAVAVAAAAAVADAAAVAAAAAAAAAAADSPRWAGESDYSYGMRVYYWPIRRALYDKWYGATKAAFVEKRRPLIVETWELQANCLERMLEVR